MFDIGKGIDTPITGLHIYRIPGKDKYFILVTTATKLYQFKGTTTDDKPVLQQVFKTYLNMPEKFETVPFGGTIASKLDVYYNNIKEAPKRFAWLTANGIYYSNVGLIFKFIFIAFLVLQHHLIVIYFFFFLD